MKLVSCQNGRILTSLKSEQTLGASDKILPTGWDPLDAIAPDGGFARGAIHELLWESSEPLFFAAMLARALVYRRPGRQAGDHSPATRVSGCDERGSGVMVWCDPQNQLYPPAVAALGIPLQHLYLLRPSNRDDCIWALTECLRCKGIAATIAPVEQISRIEARRLQLAAEGGGGLGLLLRPMIRTRSEYQTPPVYAAATRWIVAPQIGEPTIQRWKIQLIHGHGGRVGNTVILEHCRETNLVRASEKLADRPMETRLRTVG